jgi:trehalose 6-phosphate phosphatase
MARESVQRTRKQQVNRLPAPPPLDRAAALFLDVDGTLLEIAADPMAVEVPPRLPALLARLAWQRNGALALVSGRPLAQLDFLFAWRGAAAGLHGAEWRRADGGVERAGDAEAVAALDRLRPQLTALAAQHPGVTLEDKGATIAVHYRATPQHGPAILAEANRMRDPALRVIRGKMVVEWQPRGSDKGQIIGALLADPPFRGRSSVYLGDDTTDEDAFAEISRRGGTAILVGTPRPTRAAYRLASVAAALSWLDAASTDGR